MSLGPIEIFFAAISTAVAAGAARRALTAGSPARVETWAGGQGLELNDENREVVAGYLTRSGRCRAAGALGGFIAAYAVEAFNLVAITRSRPGGSWSVDFIGLLVFAAGYLLGVLSGAASGPRRPNEPRRVASLAPRRLETYAPRAGPRWIAVGTLSTVAVAIAFFVLPKAAGAITGEHWMAVLPAIAVAYAVMARILSQMLLERPQPVGTASEVATDDAIRSAGVRGILGAAVVLVWMVLSVEVAALGLTDVPVLNMGSTTAFAATGLMVLTYVAWRSIVDPGHWRVHPQVEGRRV